MVHLKSQTDRVLGAAFKRTFILGHLSSKLEQAFETKFQFQIDLYSGRCTKNSDVSSWLHICCKVPSLSIMLYCTLTSADFTQRALPASRHTLLYSLAKCRSHLGCFSLNLKTRVKTMACFCHSLGVYEEQHLLNIET